MRLTVEQLLQPRYRVIALYPFSPYKVGDIIEHYEGQFPVLNIASHDLIGRVVFTQHSLPIAEAAKYTHLFHLCHWSEGRTKEEFPEYVAFSPKFKPEEIFKVERMKLDEHGHVKEILCEGEIVYYLADIYHRPATQEEYESYKRK